MCYDSPLLARTIAYRYVTLEQRLVERHRMTSRHAAVSSSSIYPASDPPLFHSPSVCFCFRDTLLQYLSYLSPRVLTSSRIALPYIAISSTVAVVLVVPSSLYLYICPCVLHM
ncbi:hypothetical protein L226DRAFT_66577 [Lentinus tigrinus ALCF2SS1-7]|uniref:Uncharacterized protein n=1 Tax=Lentinus tigrinus ALCF2SS1-6 TaxID=1328759 RepID=A0A5C2S8S4_9APHY|nr:hypothetical protein L227DRAFT_107195 [Lentinus tigrinus ALCF2SS1-6]RPD74823.1 hypothetical protein L226DRAFT_66577 [Lentinus tigrinus ALCF2SS1-7]